MLLTRERLLEVLDYNPETGIFVWKTRPNDGRWSKRYAGKVANTERSGYIRFSIDNKRYQAHILAWLAIYGAWPDKFIDHKNLNKKDNRIVNLRLANFTENSINAKVKNTNTSGYRGVHFKKQRQRWVAYVQIRGVKKQIGSFKDKQSAVVAHAEAARKNFRRLLS